MGQDPPGRQSDGRVPRFINTSMVPVSVGRWKCTRSAPRRATGSPPDQLLAHTQPPPGQFQGGGRIAPLVFDGETGELRRLGQPRLDLVVAEAERGL